MCEYLEEQKRQVEQQNRQLQEWRKSTVRERDQHWSVISKRQQLPEEAQDERQPRWRRGSKCRKHFDNFRRRRARIAALEIQLQIEQTGALTAEQERSALFQTLVTTLSKGSRKGKGKRDEGQNHMSNVKCWNCGKSWTLSA